MDSLVQKRWVMCWKGAGRRIGRRAKIGSITSLRVEDTISLEPRSALVWRGAHHVLEVNERHKVELDLERHKVKLDLERHKVKLKLLKKTEAWRERQAKRTASAA